MKRPNGVCQDCTKPTDSTYARYCGDCRYTRRLGAGRFFKARLWTPEQDELIRDYYQRNVKYRAAILGKKLGIPESMIGHRAAQLGVRETIVLRKWTKEEDEFLLNKAGTCSRDWIAKKLKRSPHSVGARIRFLGGSAKYHSGYTFAEVKQCFGVGQNKLRVWIKTGLLKPVKRFESEYSWLFTNKDLKHFVKNNPMAFDVRRVDQLWFITLMTSGVMTEDTAEGVYEN